MYEYTYSNDDGLPHVGSIKIHPWSTSTEQDILNQTESSIYNPDGSLTLTIDGIDSTKTVDDWIVYFLKI